MSKYEPSKEKWPDWYVKLQDEQKMWQEHEDNRRKEYFERISEEVKEEYQNKHSKETIHDQTCVNPDCVNGIDIENFNRPCEKCNFDNINKPKHYNIHPSGIECIQITEHMNFCLGNAIKYIWRAGLKNSDKKEDLEKAIWYIAREITRAINENGN